MHGVPPSRRSALGMLASATTGLLTAGTCSRASSGLSLVLRADAAGHHWAVGTVNGLPVRFLVDTGASAVTLSQGEADRLRLPWRTAPIGQVRSAAGTLPARLLELAEVHVGPLRAERVGAVVVPGREGITLLGLTFVSRFRMRREDDVLTLEPRR
jgi:aspartyl protease family protein